MKPTYSKTAYSTLDLTQCPIHVKEDGSLVAMVPIKWKASEPGQAMAANGQLIDVRSYLVTEFKEVTIAPAGSVTQPPGGQDAE